MFDTMKKQVMISSIFMFAVFGVPVLMQASDTEYCDKYMKEILVSEKNGVMSVAIEQNGKTLYEFADGNREGKFKDFSKDTPLHVASITKIFTSTLMIRLMEDGKLSIYDNVRKHIPEFPFDDILLLHLMTHTSGCSGYKQKDKKDPYENFTRTFPVDTNFTYYSHGYDVLADVIERASGMPVHEYAKQEIFDKIGMNDSSFQPNVGQAGMRTTAADLLKFARHILDIKKAGMAGILTPFSVDLMFREHTRGRYDRSPAFFLKSQTRRFGRYFGDLNSECAAGHAGATGCFLLLDPKYDLSIVILSNGFSGKWTGEDENFVRINNILTAHFAK